MTFRLAVLTLLVVAPAARGQTLIDAAAAGAIQGSLQGGSTPSYLGALQRSRQILSGAPGSSATAMPTPAATSMPAPTGEGPPATATFRVNGRVIGLCASGLPCMGQIRRAMGLR